MTDPNPTPPPTDPVQPVSYMPPNADGAYLGPPPDADAKSISALAHFFNVVPLVPLLIYLIKKDSHPFVRFQSAEALNFALTCLIIHLVCGFTSFLCIPALISLALLVAQIVFGIMGGLKVKEGLTYKYPFSFKMVN